MESTNDNARIIDKSFMLALRTSRWRKGMIGGLLITAVSFGAIVLVQVLIHIFARHFPDSVAFSILAMSPCVFLLLGIALFSFSFGVFMLEYGKATKQKA